MEAQESREKRKSWRRSEESRGRLKEGSGRAREGSRGSQILTNKTVRDTCIGYCATLGIVLLRRQPPGDDVINPRPGAGIVVCGNTGGSLHSSLSLRNLRLCSGFAVPWLAVGANPFITGLGAPTWAESQSVIC